MSGGWDRRPTLTTEAIALISSLFFGIVSNRLFWQVAVQDRGLSSWASWRFGSLLLVALVCMNLCLLCLILTRGSTRPLLTVLIVTSACATYFMQAYGVYLTPAMLRNVVHSETKEAADLIGGRFFFHVLLEGVAPAALLWSVRVRAFPFRTAALRRAVVFALSLCGLSVAVLLSFHDLAPLVRNQREARYLITPANYVYSLARVLVTRGAGPSRPLIEVGADAHPLALLERRRPVLLVIVVGETVRSANWGLSGYARQTTPGLARLDVINFTNVTSCGSDTETSLPCMFAAVGRRQYDESRIRSSESLLHVLHRAGLGILWRDNQTGCKGVCVGLPTEQADNQSDICEPGACPDEVLLKGLTAKIRQTQGDQVVVLHQMGSHGPAYYRRYTDQFRHFVPTCDTSEIRECSVEQIVNSYDNALLATDHFLSRTITLLREQEDRDTALIYVSDHGESLGEHGLFLHGIPYAIAPGEQTHVPMVLWLSTGMRSSFDASCIRRHKDEPLSHDNLFHTALGLMAVETMALDHRYDLTDGCRIPRPMPGAEISVATP